MKIIDRDEVEHRVRQGMLDDHEMMSMMLMGGFEGIPELSDKTLLDYVEQFGFGYELIQEGAISQVDELETFAAKLNQINGVEAGVESHDGDSRDYNEIVGVRKLGHVEEDELWFALDNGRWIHGGWGSTQMARMMPDMYRLLLRVCFEFEVEDFPGMRQWQELRYGDRLVRKVDLVAYVDPDDDLHDAIEGFHTFIFGQESS